MKILYGSEPAGCLYEKFRFKAEKAVEGVLPGNESFRVKVTVCVGLCKK